MKNIPPYELAALFYSVAAADKDIAAIEKRTIMEIVKDAAANYPDPPSFITEFEQELNRFIEEQEVPDVAFECFANYFRKHKQLIDMETQNNLFSSAFRIGSAYSRMNKSELIIISKLKLLLSDKN